MLVTSSDNHHYLLLSAETTQYRYVSCHKHIPICELYPRNKSCHQHNPPVNMNSTLKASVALLLLSMMITSALADQQGKRLACMPICGANVGLISHHGLGCPASTVQSLYISHHQSKDTCINTSACSASLSGHLFHVAGSQVICCTTCKQSAGKWRA